MLAAVDLMGSVGFHAIAETLQEEAPRLTRSGRGRCTAPGSRPAAVEWPEELRAAAHAFEEAAEVLEEALTSDDASAAAEPAERAHDTEHELSNGIYSHLAGYAGIGAGEDEHD